MMGTAVGTDDEDCSVIGDKGEIGFIDFEDEKSVCSYDLNEGGLVTISIPFPFDGGKPLSIVSGETTAHSITIKNITESPVELWGIKIYASNPENSFTLSLMEPPSANSESDGFLESFALEDRVLQPHDTLTIWLSCKPKEIGLHTSIVHFDVQDDRFERVVFLLAEDKISQSLASNKPFSRSARKNKFIVDSFVSGTRPVRANERVFKCRLPRYDIPKNIREMVESKQIPDVIRDGLTRENYAAYFKTLLAMEELGLEENMRAHDMERVPMRKKAYQYLTLQVPGLAEKRPSLVHGDYIFARLASDPHSISYQGYIHRVEADEVFLKFKRELHLIHRDGDLYNINFTYNRVNMRRQYQAIDAADDGLEMDFLFPSYSSNTRYIATTTLMPISCILNEEQMCSIEMILGCEGGPPYVIHGPPGTGKTMTLVEAILQLYTTRRETRILICASSNSAADHILDKILSEKDIELQEYEIFRLNAATRPYEDVKTDHICHCFFEDQLFRCPPLKALMRYRIIISTYMSASLLYAEGVKRGHFSHIFLDEAGQASEPETMIAISQLCRQDTTVVLAGDPMQLGPVIYSRDAERYGLGKSYLERLFECEFYSGGDPNYVTYLVRNYRCHSEILYLPSRLFYGGELIACKDDADSSMTWGNLLPNKDFPVLFIGVQGCDEREGTNPSWFNRFEASKVIEIIKKLTKKNLNEGDIGVITPYRQQVLKLKKVLENLDLLDIKVGSVEQFQGQERQVIIISTVRSTVKHNEFDRNHCLGFLSSPRRFNVAITRARSLLVIIGNPHIISKDPHWNQLLWRCVDNDSYQGCILPDRQEFVVEEPMPQNGGEWGQQAESIPEGGDWGQQAEPILEGGDWVQQEWGQQAEPIPEGGDWGQQEESIPKGNEWGQQADSIPKADEWGQQGGEWGEEAEFISKGDEWSHQSVQAESLPKGDEWGQQSFQAESIPNGQQKWGQPSYQAKSVLKHRQDWGQPSYQAPKGRREQGRPSYQAKSNPKGKQEWGQQSSYEAEYNHNDVGWGEKSFQDEYNPTPVKDEAEWSDGWK